jgi:N-acetyl-gamma-glutamyl-phosphate reductase
MFFMISAGILGASGYSGAELMRILAARQDVRVAAVVAGSAAGRKVHEVYPGFEGVLDLVFQSIGDAPLDECDVVFSALPSGESMGILPRLSSRVGRIIDLSGDFRLPSGDLYARYYKQQHAAPDMLGNVVYGLPEIFADRIATASFVANPGCYPTSAILPLYPLLKEGAINPQELVINSCSGVSGAGRSASVELGFCEVNENIKAYKIGTHQHIPEIQHILDTTTGRRASFTFVPHLVPLARGIYTTLYARLSPSLDQETCLNILRQYYESAPFVRVKSSIPQIKDVVHTNFCDIGCMVDEHTHCLVLVSVIDNLVKGAAGQAVQNMNIMFGLHEEEGFVIRKEAAHVL